ncbi:MAG: lactate racemase domain-containing protein [Thermoguttaceae bacterium]|jgi:nickel-dependent lactate racemase
MIVLRYGTDSSVALQFAAGATLDQCGAAQGVPLADPAIAVAAALEQPLEYPPLAQATTPGDRVVVVLGSGLPQVAQVTAAVVRALMSSAIAPDGITILRGEAGMDNPLRLVPGQAAERIRLLIHDPASRRNLAYLAASEGGEPIFLNRLLTDADVVLPVGCTQREHSAGYFGIHTTIYPEFSDQHTQARFRKHDRFIGNGHHRELQHEVNHVAWLLGVNFSVQIVPAAGDGILHVLAGQSDAVRRQCRELYRAAWYRSVAHRANLVVAAIEGAERQQTWENLGRVLESASRLAEEDGAIAVCCDLAAAPGPAVQRLIGAPSREEAVREIRRDNPRDAMPALQLARALETNRIYLLSRLAPELVEDLEMTPVAGPEELIRLVKRNSSCLVLANALHAMVHVENE